MSKRQELREKRQKQERTQRILIIVGVVVIAVAVALLLILPGMNVGQVVQVTPIARTQVNFNAVGDPNAPVKIIEYADFQCPFCKNFTDDTEAQIIEAYVKTGKVYFEYRSFGEFIGVASARAAQAAYCAGDQGKFWEMHDTIYGNQGAENSDALNDPHLFVFAKNIGLDTVKFNDCFSSGKYSSKVTQDGLDAQKAGINSTPSFLINGKVLSGAQPFSQFQKEIDAALAAAQK